MSEIRVVAGSLGQMSSALNSAGSNFTSGTLSPIDARTTIVANQNAREAFAFAIQVHSLFAEALGASATQVSEAASTFGGVDSHAGSRFSTIA